jgi:hypothetical protein
MRIRNPGLWFMQQMSSQICRQFCNCKGFLGNLEATELASVRKFPLSVTRFIRGDVCCERAQAQGSRRVWNTHGR